ncbi:hypothetical protein HAZT_HAZT008478 [Hyalella azteca]|uniref:RING-type domain-containing protein n=1 Tax=Hyalella azteca TaxID=294128 RepID=A0A6A0HDH5_HYAAZ|nr:hypothetical protein HAZT_HAZT008478 [Hyalella azteca]
MPFWNFFKRKHETPSSEVAGPEDKHLLALKCMQSQQTTEPVYDISGNLIKRIPEKFHQLQSSLEHFTVSLDCLKEPHCRLLKEAGLEALLQHLCAEAGVEYTGVLKQPEKTQAPQTPLPPQPDEDLTPVMANYILKKRQEMIEHLMKEKEKEERNEEELNFVLRKQDDFKKKLACDVSSSVENQVLAKSRKLEDQLWRVELEKKMKEKQDEEIGAYIARTTSKHDKIEQLTAQEEELHRELTSIVGDRSSEQQRLIADLTASEQQVASITEEIISGAALKNAAFVASLAAQEEQLEALVSSASDAKAEVRQSEVLRAMQELLSETAALELRLHGGKTDGWVCDLLESSKHNDVHLSDVFSARQSNLKNWNEILLNDQECQAAAFKLLLLNNDIKRANIIMQIKQVEKELVRVSALELRKQTLSFEGGSMEMLEQRHALVNLLRRLVSQKKERESELQDWVTRMEGVLEVGGKDASDFWLVQYQRLMDIKPHYLAEAEAHLDADVAEVLHAANASHLRPVFARHGVSLQDLSSMDEERAQEFGISRELHEALQEALQEYLAKLKLGASSLPSKSVDGETCYDARSPSAPPVQYLPDDDLPSAPSLEHAYVEPECVVCLAQASCVLMLPCGHVCLCHTCSLPLSLCPICRTDISTKLLIGTQALPAMESEHAL